MLKDRDREAIVQEVIRLLKEEREKQGISKNRLAQMAGLSQSTVSLIENDHRSPTLDTLLRFAECLGVDLGKLVSKAIKKSS